MEEVGFFEEFKNFFYQGDPTLGSWFLVRHNFLPSILCIIYILMVKYAGPAFMKNRKPYNMRNAMIIYNSVIVAIYVVSMYKVLHYVYYMDKKRFCEIGKVSEEDGTYAVFVYGWILYLLKYVEFLDTAFFILRKRFDLVSNLHVIHHGSLPLLAWFVMRTEKSGYQALPPIINSMVHIIMYTYYALAAMGPNVRKYLWWKRYLTLLQMVQFVVAIILQIIVIPLGRCGQTKLTFYLNIIGAIIFFLLFYNFYKVTFKVKRHQPEKAD